jgi:lipopolysaccharide export LptBFGC system permease protein LptF
MTFTLQKYILRELLRAFVLTAVALTCMMGFGGGMVDLMRNEGLSAQEMLKVLICLMPIVMAYSLPVAALFSTTITYGRLAADNEITACRASGINIHRLLIPAVILSIFVFITTFTLENYLIPNLAGKIERLVTADIQKIAYLRLKNQGFIDKMGFTLHCGSVENVIPPEERPDGTITAGQIQLSHVAFMDHEDGSPIHYGTAQKALIVFDSYNDAPTVSLHLYDVRMFNEKQGQMIQMAYHMIPPQPLPSLTRKKIKFLSLPDLLAIADDPLSYDDLKKMADALQVQFRNSLAYKSLVKQVEEYGECRFQNGEERCTITADNFRERTDKDGKIILEGNVTLKHFLQAGLTRTYTAREAYIAANTPTPDATPLFTLELKNEVKVTESQKGKPDRFGERKDILIGPIPAPASVVETAQNITLDQLLDEDSPYNYNGQLSKFRGNLALGKIRTVGKAVAEIHGRTAYSASVLVLLVLGAGLGIIFRGGHFVSAFGLSFIPLLVVVVMIMTGKQLTTSGAVNIGIGVIWLGVAITMLANIVVLGKFLKR